jgi:hypothetical protein
MGGSLLYRFWIRLVVSVCFLWFGSSIILATSNLNFMLHITNDQGKLESKVSNIQIGLTHFVDGRKVLYPIHTLSNYSINNGLLRISIPVKDTYLDYFDQPGLSLSVYIEALDDSFLVPFVSVPKSVISSLSDRTVYLGSGASVSINYLNQTVAFGGAPSTMPIYVHGTVSATQFLGDGRYITGISGDGLADDSSLERYGSRLLSNKVAIQDSDKGVDTVVVHNTGYVGINTDAPLRTFDAVGRVLFLQDKHRVGDFKYPLNKQRFLLAWDHVQGAFKFGYVTRNASVQNQDAFSRAGVAIGHDIVNQGAFSSVLGGVGHTVSSNYSVVLGGKYHNLDHNSLYSSVLAGDSNVLNARNVLDISGEGNIIFSNQSLAIASKGNQLQSGKHQVVIGDNNTLNGNSIYVIGGSNYSIAANHVLAMGHVGGSILAPYSWVINLTDQEIPTPVYSKQVIWAAPNGISINTSNVGVDLSVGGALELTAPDTYFYGDGSELEDVLLQDKFWSHHNTDYGEFVSLLDNYKVVLGNAAFNSNRLNLEYGVRLLHDQSTYAGTLFYKNDRLQGYIKDGVAKDLLHQDENTTYQFSSVFKLTPIDSEKHNVKLDVTENSDIDIGKALVFDGQGWVRMHKSYWENNAQHIWYNRPVGFWSNNFYGRLTLAAESNSKESNRLRFSSFQDPNESIVLGDSFVTLGDYQVSFLQRSFIVSGNNVPIVSIQEGTHGVRFFSDFASSFSKSVYVATKSQFENLMIDGLAEGSNLRNKNLDFPFLQYNNNTLNIRSAKGAPIQFYINSGSHSMITDNDEFIIGSTNEAYYNYLKLPSRVAPRAPMMLLMDGDAVLDSGYNIGVFNTAMNMLKGLQFNDASIILKPSSGTNVYVSGDGLRVRGDTDRGVLTVVDASGDSILRVQSGTDLSKPSEWQLKNGQEVWKFGVNNHTFNIATANGLVLEVDAVANKLNIHQPSFSYADINIGGALHISGNVPLHWTGTGTHGVQVTQNSVQLASSDTINIKQDSLIIDALGVGIGGNPSSDSNIGLTVSGATHIKNGLYIDYYGRYDPIESKTIKGSAAASSPLYNLTTLGFNDAEGFNISASTSTLDADGKTVSVEFDPYFSTINIQNLSGPPTSLVPVGADSLAFTSPHFNIEFMDNGSRLVFTNSLFSQGGEIASSVSVNGVVRIQKASPGSGLSKITGSIKSMTNIPFPWKQVGTYQVVPNTIQIGIGTVAPEYPLHVAGDTSVTNLSAQVVSINSMVHNSSVFVTSEKNTVLNVRNNSNRVVQFGALSFIKPGAHFFGAINESICSSLNDVKFKVCSNSDAIARFKNTTNVSSTDISFGSDKILSLSDGLSIGNNKSIYIMNGRIALRDDKLGLLTDTPKNALDIAGSLLVGDNISTSQQNTMIVQGRVGFGNSAPDLNKALNLIGSMRIGSSHGFFNKNNDGDALFVDDSLHIHTQHSGSDGLYVSGNAVVQSIQVDGGVSIGVSGSDLVLTKDNAIDIQATSNFVSGDSSNNGLVVKNNIGVGTSIPLAPLHINKSDALKIESATSLAQLEFGDNVALQQDDQTLKLSTRARPAIQINSDGVDIDYSESDPPTHNNDIIALDVNGDMDASGGYALDGVPLGHVPTGSIIMWSGWTSELPDGWKVCDGGDTETGTAECDLRDQFIIGSQTQFKIQPQSDTVDWNNIPAGGTTTHTSTDTHTHTVNNVDHKHSPVMASANTSLVYKTFNNDKDMNTYGGKNIMLLYIYTSTTPYIGSIFSFSSVGSMENNVENNLKNSGGFYSLTGFYSYNFSLYYQTSNTNHDHDFPDGSYNGLHTHNNVTEETHSHNHNLEGATHQHPESTEHSHGNKQEEPKYYTLMFIYLEGKQ